jgi:hypothetical protein
MHSHLHRPLALLGALLIATVAVAQNGWTVRNPTPTDALINQITYGAGKFVAVGNSGTVLTSDDGITWTEQPRLAERPTLSCVVFGNAVFVALDQLGTSYTSPDGRVWTKGSSTGLDSSGPMIAFGNGLFLAKSAGNLFATSTDGRLWTPRTTGVTLAGWSIAFDGTQFLVATGSRTYLTTTDAITWTPRIFPTGSTVYRFVAGSNRIVAELSNGLIAQSTDGITWATPSLSQAYNVGEANGKFFAVANNQIATSADGLTWTATGTSVVTDPLGDASVTRKIAYGAGTYVTFFPTYAPLPPGPSNYNYYYSRNQYTAFVSSSDGVSWVRRSQALLNVVGVAYGQGLFVAGDYLSSDGVNWSPGGFGRLLFRDTFYYSYGAYRYAFCNDRFFALQQSGGNRVYTSTDGVNATLVASTVSSAQAVAYGAGRYVLVGNFMGYLTSTDAQTWSYMTLPDNPYCSDVIFANGRFVALGSLGAAYTSTDGLTWTKSTMGSSWWSSCVAYGNGRYVVVRGDSSCFYSTDGRIWTGLPTAFGATTLEFANGQFVGTDSSGVIYTSTDGTAWTKNSDTHSSFGLEHLAYGNGQWVATNGMLPGTLVQFDTTSGPATPPVVVQPPMSQSIVGTNGGWVPLVASVTGTGPFTYQWYRDGVLLAGETTQTLVVQTPEVTANTPHDYRVTITGPGGSVTSPTATVTVIPPQPPVISSQPADATPALHATATFTVAATGTGPFTYQWYKDGQPLVASAHHLSLNAKTATLTIDNVAPVDDGDYTVVVSGRAGSVTSRAARLTVNHSRLVNLSARARIGTGEDALFVGFVLANDNAPATAANATLLVRGIGPGLSDKGIANYLSDPTLNLFQRLDGQQVLQSVNNDWGDNTGPVGMLYAETAARVGAFELATGSKDSALVRQANQRSDATPQVYSVELTAATGALGVALTEVYDASLVHARLMNLSARGHVGAGEDVLTAGFVIRGPKPLKVLLRGVGPALGAQGIQHPLADPKLTLFDRHGGFLASNEDWGQNAEIAAISAATAATGAFPLAAGSKDSVLLLSLDPGIYTVQVSSQTGAGGVGLVEIYEAP